VVFHADDGGALRSAQVEEGEIRFLPRKWVAEISLRITPPAAEHLLDRGGAEVFGRELLEAVLRAERECRGQA